MKEEYRTQRTVRAKCPWE